MIGRKRLHQVETFELDYLLKLRFHPIESLPFSDALFKIGPLQLIRDFSDSILIIYSLFGGIQHSGGNIGGKDINIP